MPASRPHSSGEAVMPIREVFAAIDLGASSGRVVAGLWDGVTLSTREVARFATPYGHEGALLKWDVRQVFASSIKGLQRVRELCEETGATFAGIGIDSWGVDFALLRSDGIDLDDVRHHRGAGVPPTGREDFRQGSAGRYALTGVLDQSINTSQQLAARLDDDSIGDATLLFIPDLWVYLLSENVGTDPSIASTSQLLDAVDGTWAAELSERLHASGLIFPPVGNVGDIAGETSARITSLIGARNPVPVFRVAGHDTASALAFAAPARRNAATSGLVSSGTWSLAGLSLADPVLTADARTRGFTNERGLKGHLLVKNLSGMWLLQESLRTWGDDTGTAAIAELVRAAGEAAEDEHVLDLADPRLLEPGDMPRRIAQLAVESGRYFPTTPAEIARTIFDSLAAAYSSAVHEAADLAGVSINNVRIVGGGSRNALLCQLTANRSDVFVVAGPAEASALGNIATQLWASGQRYSITAAYAAIAPEDWVVETYAPRRQETPA